MSVLLLRNELKRVKRLKRGGRLERFSNREKAVSDDETKSAFLRPRLKKKALINGEALLNIAMKLLDVATNSIIANKTQIRLIKWFSNGCKDDDYFCLEIYLSRGAARLPNMKRNARLTF